MLEGRAVEGGRELHGASRAEALVGAGQRAVDVELPPETVAPPPAPPPCDSQVELDQSEGRPGPPENSEPTVGVSVTSPLPVFGDVGVRARGPGR